MNRHKVVVELFRLAKMYRGRAMDNRQEANRIVDTYRGERAEEHIAKYRELAAKDDETAAFYKQAAHLAKDGARAGDLFDSIFGQKKEQTE